MVLTSVPPLESLIEAIGAPHISVRALVETGTDHHHYSPTPHQVEEFASATIFFLSGIPFENNWLPRIAATNPQLRVVDLATATTATADYGQQPDDSRKAAHGHSLDPTKDSELHMEGSDHKLEPRQPVSVTQPDRSASPDRIQHIHDHQAESLHPWTSIHAAQQMTLTIYQTLTNVDPLHSDDYRKNYRRVSAELAALDSQIRTLLKPFEGRKFLVFHPAWEAFAQEYGLVQLAIEKDGKEPGARRMAELISTAKTERLQTIFVRPHLDHRRVQQLAAALEADVIVLDPLAQDYPAYLLTVATKLAESLGQ